MQFLHGTNIDFLGKRKTLIYFSLVLNALGIILPLVLGLKFGIDFTGGTEVGVELSGKANATAEIREIVEKGGVFGIEIKSFGRDNQYLIRVPADAYGAGVDVRKTVEERLQQSMSAETVKILMVNNIGAKVGSELRTAALIAVVLAILAIMLYIAFRFEFTFGIGAAVAIIHDVLVTLAFVTILSKLGILNLEMNTAMIAAFLTVIGFSVNDTVIIFDRVRENLEKHKAMNLIQLMNLSINETLSRTVNTVMTVVLVLLTMTLFGGEGLEGFAFTMLIGIVTGTYSSIYIASAFVIWYIQNVQKKDIEGEYESQKSRLAKA
ncbi:MAG: protein translocase subunit SecF [Candidatus Kapabacteria bacterium]|jgi:preprotein translocase subunit SecF|nr:protein translocase subunit SecF [Candidatus Kapabacteria bacterium]